MKTIICIIGTFCIGLISSFKPYSPPIRAAKHQPAADELDFYRMQHNRDNVDKSGKLNKIVETQFCIIQLSE